MGEKLKKPTPCAYIDGTSGIQCVLYMARITGRPSLTKIGNGTLETPGGPIFNSNFYLCEPAMLWNAKNHAGETNLLDTLIDNQMKCSHYDTTRKIPIMKKYEKVRK